MGRIWAVIAIILIILIVLLVTPNSFMERIATPFKELGENAAELNPDVGKVKPPPEINASQMEMLVHDLVNMESVAHGLKALKWNGEVAYAARLHSEDMARNDFFDHKNLKGEYHSDRLGNANIYYYNASAENIYQGSVLKYYTYTTGGAITSKTYKTEEQLTKDAVEGWMNSTGHRKNILTKEFDEAGVGIAVAPDNETYYFTQVFITRAQCGYKTGPCCEERGYYPWCYVPYECVKGVCG